MPWIRAYIIKVLLIFLPALCVAQGLSYPEIYDAECRQALGYWLSRKGAFEIASEKAGVPAEFMFAIVAPEISQFSNLADNAQTYALKVLYVQHGRNYADFSIGRFQMKPSFVEAMEEYVLGDAPLAAMFPEVPIEGMTGRDARIERVSRLENPDWQMTYLALFCHIVQSRFPEAGFASEM